MKIHVNAELRRGGRSGVEVRCPELRLTSHGVDDDDALLSLKRGIVAWAYGLQAQGGLETTLKRRGVRWESDGEAISVEVAHVTADAVVPIR